MFATTYCSARFDVLAVKLMIKFYAVFDRSIEIHECVLKVKFLP